MYEIGQTIYGNGEWQARFPKGIPYVIKTIYERGSDFTGRKKFGFEFDGLPPCHEGYDGWHDIWFTTVPPPPRPPFKGRVIRD